VKTTGCSGMAYVLEFVDELNEEDEVFDFSGVKIIIDKKSLVYLDGTELDYVKEGLNEGFEFNNPNAKSECGCGESFNV
ncbi:iron-sulfur cluster assembly accessory protein, partial [Escherichia coli]|nr:iron-sulfur cluster assembly accessory protein [Escherichia coli]